MIEIKDKSLCTGCHACYNVCPVCAIKMEKDSEGFEYPKIDKQICINCGLCDKICPIINKAKVQDNEKIVYAGFNNNAEDIMKSSSGGIFVLLARKVLAQNGYVYGAAFDENNNLKHICAKSEEELLPLLKSKYLQSKIEKVYIEIKKYLLKNKMILFCGTPCQVVGLKNYLGKEYHNLITIDFICHGVSNQLVLDKYIEMLEKKNCKKIKSIEFRTKTKGWTPFGLKFVFEDETYQEKFGIEDDYLKAFLFDVSLRPSCYNCFYKGLDRESDITLADAWDINKLDEALCNKWGTSLIIVHTHIGRKLIKALESESKISEIDPNFVRKYNVNAFYSVIKDKRRNKFFKRLLKENDFNQIVEQNTKISIPIKIERKLKRMINERKVEKQKTK